MLIQLCGKEGKRDQKVPKTHLSLVSVLLSFIYCSFLFVYSYLPIYLSLYPCTLGSKVIMNKDRSRFFDYLIAFIEVIAPVSNKRV